MLHQKQPTERMAMAAVFVSSVVRILGMIRVGVIHSNLQDIEMLFRALYAACPALSLQLC